MVGLLMRLIASQAIMTRWKPTRMSSAECHASLVCRQSDHSFRSRVRPLTHWPSMGRTCGWQAALGLACCCRRSRTGVPSRSILRRLRWLFPDTRQETANQQDPCNVSRAEQPREVLRPATIVGTLRQPVVGLFVRRPQQFFTREAPWTHLTSRQSLRVASSADSVTMIFPLQLNRGARPFPRWRTLLIQDQALRWVYTEA